MRRSFAPSALRSPSLSLLLLALVAGCGARASMPERMGIEELRSRADESPTDAALHRQLALAELFAHDGDASRAQARLKHALPLNSGDPGLELAAGLDADAHGRPSAAFDHYLTALTLAADSDGPVAPHLAELAAMALASVQGEAPNYLERVHAPLKALADRPELGAPARFFVKTILMELAQRQGDRAEDRRLAESAGCVTAWRAAGPFGPRPLLGFDRDHGVDPAQPLADSYDLGPAGGMRSTRSLGARGCAVSLGGGAVPLGGTRYVSAEVQVPVRGPYLMRLETPNSVEVFLDGQSRLRVDRRRHLSARVRFLPLELSAGSHRFLLKVSARHPNPVLSLALNPQAPQDLRATALPLHGKVRSGYGMFLRAALALSRGDLLEAREVLQRVSADRRASPILLMQRATVAMSDPLTPLDVRKDQTRRLLLAAAARDETLWKPPMQLAALAADNGRGKEAVAVLREAVTRWPRVPALALSLVELLRGQGWHEEADREVRRVRELVPTACAPLSAQLAMERRRRRESEAAVTAEAIMQCDARANARYALRLRLRDWAGAKRELERLEAQEPPQDRYGWLLARLELAKNAGDQAAQQAAMQALRTRYPRSVTGVLEQLDARLAAAHGPQALSDLQQALKQEPADLAALYRLLPVLGGEHPLAAHRKDGLAAIRAYEKSGRVYEQPQVLVFDYMAQRIFEDGSSLTLVHTVQRVQSDEAVDQLGEVSVPEGARVLTLRNVKPDGRLLEPDAIAGKDTISLPSVAAGDYVEVEFIQATGPSDAFPRGYLGDRFYFKSFEVPFDYSHMVVVLPRAMQVSFDPRGPAPEVSDRIEGDTRVLEWKVQQSEPLVAEPGSVNAAEYIPSVRIGVAADWEPFVESIREVLVDRDLVDPAVERLVGEVVAEAAPGDHRLRAERLYAWVLEHVENNNDMFSQAAAMLRARTGNRARVLHYLLGLAGVPSRLALVRSVGADTTESEMADTNTYEHLALRVGKGEQALWLFTVERWAPFGYMPPPLRGQPALILEPGLSRARVSPSQAGQDRRDIRFDLHLEADGSARVDAVETVHGSGAVAWRGQLESIPAAELERRFEDDYVARLLPGASLASLSIVGREVNQASIRLEYSFDVDVLGRKVSQGWALPATLQSELATNYARAAKRTTSQLIGSPLDTNVTLRFHFPEGSQRPALPANMALQDRAGSRGTFEAHHSWDGEVLVMQRRMRLPVGRVAAQHYAGFANFCRQVDAVEARELIFR